MMKLKYPIFVLLLIAGIAACKGPVSEKNGLLEIEVESVLLEGNWMVHESEDSLDFIKGFSGDAVLQFTGNTEVSGPPDSPLSYSFRIQTPGTYRLKMRALEAPLETGEGDKANDCYLKLAGGEDWLGEYTKFVLLGDSYTWSWNVLSEPHHHEFEAPEYALAAGEYEILIAGRSKNFIMDKIVLYKVDAWEEEDILEP